MYSLFKPGNTRSGSYLLWRVVRGLRPARFVLLISLLLVFQAYLIAAAYAQEFPALSGRVVDLAELLDEAQEATVTQTLATHEVETSNQIVVTTIDDLQGYDIADYANRLGRHWGIGTAELSNGVLLLVAPNERQVRIEVGYGLEGALTDSLSSVIIQREILPSFRSGDYPGGITQGVDAILQAVAGEYVAEDAGRAGGARKFSDDALNFLPLIFIGIVALTEGLRRTGYRRAANSAFPAGFAGLFSTLVTGRLLVGLALSAAVFLFVFFKGQSKGTGTRTRSSYPGTAGGYSGGGFGGGGFSGGGGSFGGGGASGSW